MTGRGDYIFYTNRHNFFNSGIREAQMNTDHQMVLSVFQGGEAQRNDAYQRRRR